MHSFARLLTPGLDGVFFCWNLNYDTLKESNISQRINGTGIFTYNWRKFMVNVATYAIRGSYGYANIAGKSSNQC